MGVATNCWGPLTSFFNQAPCPALCRPILSSGCLSRARAVWIRLILALQTGHCLLLPAEQLCAPHWKQSTFLSGDTPSVWTRGPHTNTPISTLLWRRFAHYQLGLASFQQHSFWALWTQLGQVTLTRPQPLNTEQTAWSFHRAPSSGSERAE